MKYVSLCLKSLPSVKDGTLNVKYYEYYCKNGGKHPNKCLLWPREKKKEITINQKGAKRWLRLKKIEMDYDRRKL